MRKFLLLNSAAIIAVIPSVYMSDAVETVAIVTDNGPVRINKSDFNEKEHKLFKGNKTHDENGVLRNPNAEQRPAGTMIPQPSAELSVDEKTALKDRVNKGNFGVMEDRKKFYIVDSANNGEKVTDIPGIDGNGYKNAKDAWDALLAAKKEAGVTA